MKKEEFYRDALADSKGPLEGIRVLEATTEAAGPFAGTLLADLGAEDIKCDMPRVGDSLRHFPPFLKGEPRLETSTFYLSINRNKKCITLNFKTDKGQKIFRELAQQVDVVIQNFKPGTMDKWGLGYQDIKRVKPDIIYVSISGYGQFGPLHTKPGYDAVGQAMGGLMSVTGYPDGPPTRAGTGIADDLTGWQGAFGSLAALHYRNRTGLGQHVDISQVDSILYTSDHGLMMAANAGHLWKRMGSGVPGAVPYDTYQCKDGEYLFLAVGLDSHWARLCRIIGREDLIEDSRTKTPADRGQARTLIDEAINSWIQDKTLEEALAILEEAQLVVTPILDYNQILKNEHFQARDMVVDIEHPLAGKVTLYGVASKYSLTPARVRTPAPLLGQHNIDVYRGMLGYSLDEIRELEKEGVI